MITAPIRLLRRYASPIVVDALVVVVSLLLAWSGRSVTANLSIVRALRFAVVAMVVYCLSHRVFGLYHRLWRYASAAEVTVIGASVVAGTLTLFVVDLLWPGPRLVPLSVVLFTGFFSFVGFVAVRYQGRLRGGLRWRMRVLGGGAPTPRIRVLIFGAGEAGQLLAWRFLNLRQGRDYRLVGFVDDNPAKLGMRVHGRPVLGDRQAIPELVTRHKVDVIIIAIHGLNGQALRGILDACEHAPVRIKLLPDILELAQRTNGLPLIRDVTLEDLIGRRPVEIDHHACRSLLAGKTVLVTGAAGSIGSELCRQIARFGPQSLLMLDNNESGLFDLATELQAGLGSPPIRSIIADVTNRPKMARLFAEHRPQVVFHAAAYKHVPLMEAYPEEAVRVNVLGTLTVADLACAHSAERFVLISTDKAVHPTCVMGATKRLGELLVSSVSGQGRTLCTGVRFGNVLGSRGSVVPTFEKQIEMGGPVTITHPEMTRYFMSIPEAVSLVIQAATITQGGDLFVLDMGEQVRIEELAERLIRLRGLRPGIDIPIKYTGVRPGEKLHEELTGSEDETQPTAHPAILRVNGARRVDGPALRAQLEELIRLAEAPYDREVAAKLWEIVAASPVETRQTRR